LAAWADSSGAAPLAVKCRGVPAASEPCWSATAFGAFSLLSPSPSAAAWMRTSLSPLRSLVAAATSDVGCPCMHAVDRARTRCHERRGSGCPSDRTGRGGARVAHENETRAPARVRDADIVRRVCIAHATAPVARRRANVARLDGVVYRGEDARARRGIHRPPALHVGDSVAAESRIVSCHCRSSAPLPLHKNTT